MRSSYVSPHDDLWNMLRVQKASATRDVLAKNTPHRCLYFPHDRHLLGRGQFIYLCVCLVEICGEKAAAMQSAARRADAWMAV
jgi:hypothetical protein